ncbi:MAG: hypothetical protein IPK72_00675 [Candidatus Eisenbacteria bacterium]|nr:hypothetical protein [Candidatus Eisenbacteria bacterium]
MSWMVIASSALGVILLGLIAFQIWVRNLVRRSCREGAERIFRELTAMFDGEHVFKVVDRSDYPELSEELYTRTEAFLAGRGLGYVGSLEDLTVTQANPNLRTRIDCFTSSDGRVGGVTYRIHEYQVLEFCTAFETGAFLTTTNAEVDKLEPPPMLHRETLRRSTEPLELLQRHLDRVAETQRPGGGARIGDSVDAANQTPPRIALQRTLEDLLVMGRRSTLIASQHRRALGYLTPEELNRMAADPGQEAVARILWQEFEKIRSAQRAA